jgi:hypothetical protein
MHDVCASFNFSLICKSICSVFLFIVVLRMGDFVSAHASGEKCELVCRATHVYWYVIRWVGTVEPRM